MQRFKPSRIGNPKQTLTEPKPGLMSNARALARLDRLFSMTGVHILRFATAAALEGRSLDFCSRRVQMWSADMLRVLGVEVELHGEPPKGAMVVANHRSYIDICVLAQHMPCVFLSKAELKKWPVLGTAAKLGHTIFVERENRESRKQAREELARVLSLGVSTVVFPEGTTRIGPGAGAFRPGIFHVATQSGVPVVPAVVEYEHPQSAWVGDDTFIGHFLRTFGQRRIRATVRFGEPLTHAHADGLRLLAQRWVDEESHVLRRRLDRLHTPSESFERRIS